MLLTPEQLREIRQIVEVYHSAFIANTISPDVLAPDMLARLRRLGLINTRIDTVRDAYIYGQILATAEDPKLAGMGYEEFKRYLRSHPVPLTSIERDAMAFASQRAGDYCRGLGNRVAQDTGQLLIEADANLRRQMRQEIRTATERNIAERESLKKLKSDLGWATKDWARDWQRIANTETHFAMQRGVAEYYGKRYGAKGRVAVRAMPDACNHCKRLFVGSDGQPIIFELGDLEANGTNVGRKAVDWLPVVPPVHPHCFPPGVCVLTSKGSKPIEKLSPGELVLSREGTWEPISHVWTALYSGEITTIKCASGATVTATANHPFDTDRGWVVAQKLVQGDNLINFGGEVGFFPNSDSVDTPAELLQNLRLAQISFGFSWSGVPITAIHFDGQTYVGESQINQKSIDQVIDLGDQPSGADRFVNQAFVGRFEFTGLGEQTELEKTERLGFAPDSGVESGNILSAGVGGHPLHSEARGLRLVSGSKASAPQPVFYRVTGNAKSTGYFLDRQQAVEVQIHDNGDIEFAPERTIGTRHPAAIATPDPIVNVSSDFYCGVVYNLTTRSHSFTANGLAVHNCQCQLIRVPDGWGFNEDGQLVPDGELGTEYGKSEAYWRVRRADDLRRALEHADAVDYQGIRVRIENPVGSVRRWRDAEGHEGQTRMQCAYGYAERTTGADGDGVDVFLGPNPEAPRAWIVHQRNPHTGAYDEDKVMLGFSDQRSAINAYEMHYDTPAEFFGAVSEVTVDQLRRWLAGTEMEDVERALPSKQRLRLVIPLNKAAATFHGSDGAALALLGPAAEHVQRQNPSPGTSGNYALGSVQRSPMAKQVGWRPTPREELELMQQDATDLDHWFRDKAIYQVPEQVPHAVKIVIPADHQGTFPVEDAERNKAHMEEQQRRRVAAQRNLADIVAPRERRG